MGSVAAHGGIAGALVMLLNWWVTSSGKAPLPPEVTASLTILIGWTSHTLCSVIRFYFPKLKEAFDDRSNQPAN